MELSFRLVWRTTCSAFAWSLHGKTDTLERSSKQLQRGINNIQQAMLDNGVSAFSLHNCSPLTGKRRGHVRNIAVRAMEVDIWIKAILPDIYKRVQGA